MAASAVREVVIPNPQGLHARPIAMLVEAAQRFDAKVWIGVEGREVDARSVLQLMTLCAACGTKLRLRAEGDDAEELVDCLERIVRRGFDEM